MELVSSPSGITHLTFTRKGLVNVDTTRQARSADERSVVSSALRLSAARRAGPRAFLTGPDDKRESTQGVDAGRHFPTERAALKCLYLVTRGLDPRGLGQARWVTRWKPALNAFAVIFADRMPAAENL